MVKDIKLPIGKEVNTKRIFHITERIPKEIKLVCPFCGDDVITRKGQINRHHFAHKNSDCSVSQETLLHEGAKIFLYNCLQKNKDIEISAPTTLIKDVFTRSLLSSQKINEITLPISSIYDISGKTHALEKKLHGFIPDVYSYRYEKLGEYFVWEIFVTHISEEKKIDFLNKRRIPFLELEPIEDNKSGYVFRLKNYGGVEIFNKKEEILSDIYKSNKSELLEIFKGKLEEDFLHERVAKELSQATDTIAKHAKESAIQEAVINLTKDKKPLSLLLAPYYTIYFKSGDYFGSPESAPSTDWLRLDKLSSKKVGKYLRISLNDNFEIDRLFLMLGGVYEELIKNDYCRFILNTEKSIIGVFLKLPDIRNGGYRTEDIIIKNQTSWKRDVDLESTYGDTVDGKQKMKGICCNSGTHFTFLSPHQQMLKLISWFKQNYRVEFLPDKDNIILAIKVVGIPREFELSGKLRDLIEHNGLQ